MQIKMGIVALLAAAGVASASTSYTPSPTLIDTVTFTNINSVDAQADVDNTLRTWVAANSGSVDQIRVTGTLQEVATATYASEARVRFTAGAGSAFTAFNLQATTTTSYTGTFNVSNTVNVTPFSLAAGGTVGLEWFESAQDGTAGLAEQIWTTVTYDFMHSAGPTVITNGNFALGTLSPGASISTTGSHVSGGVDFFTFTITDDVSGGGFLNVRTAGGAAVSMTDTLIGLYDAGGNRVSFDDDGSGASGFFSMMSFGAADPNVLPGDDAAGSDGLFLPAGTYTLATMGYSSSAVMGTTLAGIIPGTNTGNYGLSINYVPTPGALALLGMGGLIAGRRRR